MTEVHMKKLSKKARKDIDEMQLAVHQIADHIQKITSRPRIGIAALVAAAGMLAAHNDLSKEDFEKAMRLAMNQFWD